MHEVPHNNYMQRAGTHQFRDRGRGHVTRTQVGRVRVLTGQRAGADAGRYRS